jgi:four helix bundle protein
MRGLQSLRVYGSAEAFATDVARLLSRTRLSPDETAQLRRSSGSTSDLIAEGHGRGPGADRRRVYRYARGEAQESVNQLKKLATRKPISKREFFPLFNRASRS